jgi:hypothetical protein
MTRDALTHGGRFGEKEAQNLAAKVAKTHGGGTPAKTVAPGPLAGDTLKTPVAKKTMMVTPTSTQRVTDQLVADERGARRQRDSGVSTSGRQILGVRSEGTQVGEINLM